MSAILTQLGSTFVGESSDVVMQYESRIRLEEKRNLNRVMETQEFEDLYHSFLMTRDR